MIRSYCVMGFRGLRCQAEVSSVLESAEAAKVDIPSLPRRCVLCPRTTGALIRTTEGFAAVQCAHEKCDVSFHSACAIMAGFGMNITVGGVSDADNAHLCEFRRSDADFGSPLYQTAMLIRRNRDICLSFGVLVFGAVRRSAGGREKRLGSTNRSLPPEGYRQEHRAATAVATASGSNSKGSNSSISSNSIGSNSNSISSSNGIGQQQQQQQQQQHRQQQQLMRKVHRQEEVVRE
ncbi:hypothetical protein ACSSS7_005243 [Eimeria intestinalis]